MVKNKEKLRNILIVVLIIIMSIIMLFYQSKKIGFHEDEMYTIASSINPYDGVMSAYGEKDNQTIMLEKYVLNDNIFI